MQELPTMSQKEIKRIKVLEQKVAGKLIVKEASEILCMSERQTYRLLSSYKAEGDKGIIYKLRGKISNRGYPQDIRQKVIEIYWKRYRDYPLMSYLLHFL